MAAALLWYGCWGGLFIVQGLIMLAPKMVEQYGFGAYRLSYSTALFIAASVLSGVAWWRMGGGMTWPEFGFGALFGTCNITATLLTLVALGQLSAIVVFPTTSVGTILLGAAAGMLVWKERPSRIAMYGVLLAIPVAVLLNI